MVKGRIDLLAFSCSTKDTEIEDKKSTTNEITNPNGMSEMSLIMEDWYTSMKAISVNLNEGKLCNEISTIEEEKIFKAKTSKENIHGKEFDAFVENFFFNYKEISKASTVSAQVDQFNLTVKSCINCHEQFCHGPIVRIRKLTVKTN